MEIEMKLRTKNNSHCLYNRFAYTCACFYVAYCFYTYVCCCFSDCREYCWEEFNATCAQDEAVLMESARYGRMHVGRCITREHNIGCSADILRYVDRKCSGRHECQFGVPDTDLHKVQPCPKDLLAYLEATYSCVKGGLLVYVQHAVLHSSP